MWVQAQSGQLREILPQNLKGGTGLSGDTASRPWVQSLRSTKNDRRRRRKEEEETQPKQASEGIVQWSKECSKGCRKLEELTAPVPTTAVRIITFPLKTGSHRVLLFAKVWGHKKAIPWPYMAGWSELPFHHLSSQTRPNAFSFNRFHSDPTAFKHPSASVTLFCTSLYSHHTLILSLLLLRPHVFLPS